VEDDRLGVLWTPVLVENLGTVARGNRGHVSGLLGSMMTPPRFALRRQ
jgi:hypothetical protein